MIRRIFVYILIIGFLPTSLLSQKFNWANNLSNSSNKSVSTLANSNTGNTFMAGQFDGSLTVSGTSMTAKGGKDNFVTVYGKNGSTLWTIAFHFESNGLNDNAYGSYFDNSSNTYTVCGEADGNTVLKLGNSKIDSFKFSQTNYFVANFQAASATNRWIFPKLGTTNSEANAIAGDGNGNVYVAGRFNDSLELDTTLYGASNGDLFLIKIQISSGNKLWARKITGLGKETATSIIYDRANSQVVVLGNFEDTMYLGSNKISPLVIGKKDVFAARFAASGTALTLKRVIASTSDIEVLDADIRNVGGGYVVTGRFNGSISSTSPTIITKGGYDIFIATVSASDTRGIIKAYGGNSNDEGNEIEFSGSGIAYVHATYASSVFNFGTSVISKKGIRDICILASNLILNPIGGKGSGLMSLSTDQIYATAMSQSAGVLVIGNKFRGRAVYGNKGTFNSPAGFFDIGFAQIGPSSIYCNTNDTLAFSGFRTVSNAHHLCANSKGEITSLADTTFKFQWYKNGISLSGETKLNLTVSDSANYFVVMKDSVFASAVCVDTSQIARINLDTLPVVSIIGDSTCNNISTSFALRTSPNFNNFSTDSLFGRGIGNNILNSYNPSIPGVGLGLDTIIFQKINLNGCLGRDTAAVLVNPQPSISIFGVKTYCQGDDGDTLVFASSSRVKNEWYSMSLPSWGIKDSSIFRCDSLSNGFHSVKYSIIDSNNCANDTTISLEIKQMPTVSLNLAKSSACKNASIFNLSGQTPLGGYFAGVGVIDSLTGTYDPDSAFFKKDTILYVFTATNGCVGVAEDIFTIDTIPIVSFIYTDTLCDGAAIYTMKGLPFPSRFPLDSGIYSGVPGAISGNKFDPTKVTVGQKNKVIYRYVNQKGCSDTMSTIIEVRNLPNVNLPALGSYCENGGTVLFNSGAPTGGNYYYKKYLLDNDIFKPDTNYINYGSDTVYYEYTDSFKCVNTAFNFVGVKQKPSLFLNQSFFDNTCDNSAPIELSSLGVSVVSPPQSSGGYFSYDSTLSNKIDFFDAKKYSEQNINGRKALTYSYTDAISGCSDTLGIFPDVKSAPKVSIEHLGAACAGLNYNLTAKGALTWQWSTGDSTTSITVVQDSIVDYFVVGKLGICYDTATAQVVITQGEKIFAKDDSVSLQKGTDVTLDPIARLYSQDTMKLIGSFKIYAGPLEARMFDTTTGVIAQINSTIFYEPNVDFRRTDSALYEVCNINCPNICDSAKVIFYVLGNPYEFIPSAFTPNGDGINDFWVVPGLEAYPENEVYIYNRWGDLVYEALPYKNKWEGQTNRGIAGGKKLVDGTYYYVLKTNGGDPIKGTIELKTK